MSIEGATQVATKLKDLKLDDAHATAILEKAIEYESFTEDLPASKRERIKAATEQVALMIDAWVDDDVTPENEDEDVAAMGAAIQEIFEIAGVEIDDEGEVSYVDPADVDEPAEDEDDDADDDDDSEGDDGEAAVDINDVIDGYDEMSASGKVKAIKALELDMDDDDDYNTAVGLYEYEEAQEKPSSRVLSWLDDLIPKDADAAEEEAEEDEDAEDDDDAEDAEEDGEEASDEWEQPWTKKDGAPSDYDKMSAVDVKKYLDKLLAKEELSAEMVQYVIDYETNREKPPTRKRIVDYATKLAANVEEPEEEDADEPEEEPKRSGRPSNASRRRQRTRAASDPDDTDDADDAVDRDDEKESRRSRRTAKSNGTITITREQILEALSEGEIEIEV
jgi:hypothetical protein